LDLMLGGDLRFHYERKGSLGEEAVRFYIAELSSALVYLHSKHIIHRDVKPDNVLLDIAGHAHLTDFNVAVHFEEGVPLSSVAGTIYYMAPEIIRRKGYTWTADWWSLGATAYEILFGRRPFRAKKSLDVMRAIIANPLEFPQEATLLCSPEGIDCISKLLEKRPSKRLGCRPRGQGLADLRAHPWFRDIDWQKLDKKQLQPPFAPDQNRVNFDCSYELDEYMMPKDLLVHKKRKKNRDLSKLSTEMLQIEEEFTLYDFIKMKRKSYYPLNQPIMSVKPGTPGMTPIPSRPPSLQVPEQALTIDRCDYDSAMFCQPSTEMVQIDRPNLSSVVTPKMSRSNSPSNDSCASSSHQEYPAL